MRIILLSSVLLATSALAQTAPVPQRSMQQLIDEVGIAGDPQNPTMLPEVAVPAEAEAPKPAPTIDEAAKVIEAHGIAVTKRTSLNYGLYTIDMKDGQVFASPALPREGGEPTPVPAMAAITVSGTPRPPGYATVIEVSPPALVTLLGSADVFPFPPAAAAAAAREVERSKEAMPQYLDGKNPNVGQRNRNTTRALNRAEQVVPKPNENLPRNWQSVQ